MGIALKSLDAMNLGTVGVNLGNVEAYRVALKGLSVEQSVFALASKGATEEQIRQILVTDQAKLKDVEAAMAKAGLTTATKALNAEEIIELATKKGISIERAKEIASALGLIATEEGQVISKKQLTVATLQQVGATDAEITAILGLNAAETANIGITNVLTASFAKLWAVITAHPIGAILTAIGVVAVGAVAAYNKWGDTLENTKEKLSDLKSECQEIVSDLQAVNSELETTQQRLEELEGKDTLTFTEKEEYDNLVKINNELQRKIDLLELEEKNKRKEQNKTFVSAMEKDTENPFEHEVNPDGKKPAGQYSISDEYLTSETGYINAQFEIREQLLDDLANAETEKEKERIQKRIDEINSYLEDKNTEWKTVSDGIDYIENPTTEDDKAVNEWLDYIADFQDRMAIAMSKDDASSNAQYKTNTFNRVVDNWQFDETVQGLQDLGKEGKVTAEMLDDPKYDEFINKLVFLGVIDSADNLEDVALAFNSVADSAENAADSASQYGNKITVSFTEALSQINAFSEGLDQLGEIYADVKDKENFDFTSLLTDDFKETFGGFTEEYENLVKTITESPNDINACQDAFNSLATAYIYSTDALKNVTDETKNSTVALLKQMGVSNALDVVNNQLAINTSSLEKAQSNLNEAKKQGLTASVDLENATASELIKIMEESEQLGINIDDLYYYTLQKLQANEINIVTDGDLDALASLCDGLGIATTALKRYEEVKGRMSSLDSEYANRDKDSNYYARQKKILAEYDALENEMSKSASKILASKVQNKYKPTTTVKYTGSTDKDSSKDSSDSSKDSTETFDWIQTKLEAIRNEINTLDSKASATWDTWANRNKALSQELGKVTDQIKIQEKAADKYLSLFNGVNISNAYRKKIMNGEMNIEEIKDEKLAEKIKLAQGYWDNYTSNIDGANEGRNTLADKYREKFDNLNKEAQSKVDNVQREIDSFNNELEIAETKGYYITSDYYNNLIDGEEKRITALESEATTLQNSLDEAVASGKIKKGSEEWQAMQDVINGIRDEIDGAKKSVIELGIESAKVSFENIKAQAENYRNAIDYEIAKINHSLTISESKGKDKNLTDYDSIELLTQVNKANSEDELAKLRSELSNFEYGTKEYEAKAQEVREKELEVLGYAEDLVENANNRFNAAFNEATTKREDQYATAEHKINTQNTAMELKEVLGDLVTSADYEALNQQEQKQLNILEDRKASAESAIWDAVNRGDMSVGDDRWIEAWKEVFALEEEIAESNNTIAENTKKGVDADISNIKEGFSNIQGAYSHESSVLQGAISNLESSGYNVNEELYKALILNSENSIRAYDSEKARLSKLLSDGLRNDSIKEGDDQYWELLNSINEIDEAIINAENDIVGFNNSINQLRWDSFDSLMDKITNISEEASFLNSLLDESDWFDDGGNITDVGKASAALHLMNINTYKTQVKDYAKELLDVNHQLANDPANKTLLDRKEALIDAQRDLVNGIQDEEDAIISLVEKGYDKLKESLDEIISKKKEALNNEKSLYDYQKSIEEKTNKRDSLQKQLDAISGDTSEEARIEAQKLQLELNEASKDLEETQYDKWISDQEQMLDNFATDTQEWIDERLQDTNGLLAEIRDSVANSYSIDDVLTQVAEEFGIELSPEMLQILSTPSNVDTSAAIDDIKEFENMSSNIGLISENVEKILQHISDDTSKQVDVAYDENLKGYASGSHRILKDQLAITQEKGLELIARDGGLLTPLAKGDMVFTNEMTEQLWKMAQGNIPFGVVKPNINLPVVKGNNNAGINIENVGVEIKLPNVQNYEQFKDALIRDSSFEKSIKSIALDKAFGKNSLNKLRY